MTADMDSVTIEYTICDDAGGPVGYVSRKQDPKMYVQPRGARPIEWAIIRRKVTMKQALAAGIISPVMP